MNKQEIKNLIYLRALLQHIPSPEIETKVSQFAGATDPYVVYLLQLADQYALTTKGSIGNNFEQVASIFEGLKTGDKKHQYHHHPQEFSLKKEYFPVVAPADRTAVSRLWTKFTEALLKLDWSAENQVSLAKASLTLLFRYATTIPNPSNVNAEVAWYDFAKMKAGLAVCIHEYLQSRVEQNDLEIIDEEEPILIIRADLSGIQNFIYDIASKQASKNLKGRSFYIQLLSETVLQKMLDEFGLFEGNVMYASGGNFFLIAPNTKKIISDFQVLEKKIANAIFQAHQTRLSVVMGFEQVSQNEILSGKINEAIVRLFEEKVDRNKKRKFATLMEHGYQHFFEPIDSGGRETTDAITGEEVLRNEAHRFELREGSPLPELLRSGQEGERTAVIKKLTAQQIFLGHALKADARYLVMSKGEINATSDRNLKYLISPCNLGISFYLPTQNQEGTLLKEWMNQPKTEIFAINNAQVSNGSSSVFSTLLYGGTKAPSLSKAPEDPKDQREVGDPKHFDELSGDGNFKRLAVLRMDVDGLGGIFKNLNAKPLTFSYYAALSRNLDWFFKGYINTLWESNPEYKAYTQIIYSGGDDLFIIGRWDLMIQFAAEIKEEFIQYTCAKGVEPNKRLTISGGIAIVTDKFPIIKAAAYADEAEKNAKRHHLQSGESAFEKNSICLFGKPLHWDTEFRLVAELKEELVRYISPNHNGKYGLPMSMLNKIKLHYLMMRQYETKKNNHQRANPSWIWNIAYDFSRFKERQRSEIQGFVKKINDDLDQTIRQYLDQKMKFLDRMQQGIFTNNYYRNNEKFDSNYHFLELLYLASRWAELELRSKLKSTN